MCGRAIPVTMVRAVEYKGRNFTYDITQVLFHAMLRKEA